MSNADQWPTALAVITAEWLPRQTAWDASGKTDRRDWGAAPGEDDNQDRG